MVRLDSILIKAPADVITSINTDLFEHKQLRKGDNILSDDYSINRVDVGIKQIRLDAKTNDLYIDCSAKNLKRDYVEGINKNTFTQIVENINRVGVMTIDTNSLYDSASILRADVTDNVNLGYDNKTIVEALSLVPLSSKYDVSPYMQKRNLGIVYKGKQKSFKERQIFYDKFIDLNFSGHNKELRQIVPMDKYHSDFKDTIRVETNLTSFALIRKYLGSTDLKKILENDTRTNATVFKKITSSADNQVQTLFSEYEAMTIREIIRLEGIKGIIKNANYDWQFIDRFLKVKTPNNYRKTRIEFKKYYNQMTQQLHKSISIVGLLQSELSKVA